MSQKRLLIFIVAYNAEKNIEGVLQRIPKDLFQRADLHTEVLVIDDSSSDNTFTTALKHESAGNIPVRVLVNPKNLGYGGNQKLGYHYALLHNFDYVALLHGDGQYAPERLPELLTPLFSGESDAVFGSRMLNRPDALRGGMPMYKFVGNIILTTLQNFLTGAQLSEWHSGYRIYSTSILRKIPFGRNSNNFDFDTDIIIQLLRANARIREIPIPTYYGDEICHVNGIPYGCRILLSCLQNRLQSLGLFYNPKFDVETDCLAHYQPKFHFSSSHSKAVSWVKPGEKVLILGAGSPELVAPFVQKGCEIVAIELESTEELERECHKTIQGDLDTLDLQEALSGMRFDKVLALDVIEHLKSPETFLERLRGVLGCKDAEFLFTVPNVAFLPVRLMLLLGFFNYGKRGILDRTHTRLFTLSSMTRALQQSGFQVIRKEGIPAPFPLALSGAPRLAQLLTSLNIVAIWLSRGLFSFQILCQASPLPRVEELLVATEKHSREVRS
jgi:glycosyltransferase involved in cell wall biosynthesis